MHIFLTGFMGVGKTTIGKELAEITNTAFIDLDEYIEQEIGTSIDSFFKENGESAFRIQERTALLKLINSIKQEHIIALGGGTMCSSHNFHDILINGVCVYLFRDWENHWDILKKLQNRPLLEGNTEESVKTLFSKRERFYELSQLKMPINSTFTTQKLAQKLRLSTNR